MASGNPKSIDLKWLSGLTGLIKTATIGIGEVANIVSAISSKIGGLFAF